jgi:hypothetical protein
MSVLEQSRWCRAFGAVPLEQCLLEQCLFAVSFGAVSIGAVSIGAVPLGETYFVEVPLREVF